MELKDGLIELPERPGLGFTFDLEAIERYSTV
jgi:L-alanine-DL-glutamate epimerase-like enolase superfamily enzyme